MTDIKSYRSSFGGGWVVPVSRRAKEFLSRRYGAAYRLEVVGDQFGYIIEPHDAADLSEAVQAEGLTVKNRSGRA